MKGSSMVIILLFFIGSFIVIHSIYEEKLKKERENVKIEYRFLPRTVYEEQMAQSNVLGHFKSMFNKSSPWYNAPSKPPYIAPNNYDFRPRVNDTAETSDQEPEAFKL